MGGGTAPSRTLPLTVALQPYIHRIIIDLVALILGPPPLDLHPFKIKDLPLLSAVCGHACHHFVASLDVFFRFGYFTLHSQTAGIRTCWVLFGPYNVGEKLVRGAPIPKIWEEIFLEPSFMLQVEQIWV